MLARIALTIGLLALTGPAAAQPDSAQSWLERTSEARERYSFVGEFIYQHGGTIDSMRIWRAVSPESGIRERMLSLSGESREILRDQETVTCIMPSSESVMIDERRLGQPLDARLPTDPEALKPHYGVEVLGEGRVAGRPVTRLGIDARDELRYGYQLWLDDETGLLLRAELISSVGEVLERVMVLNLDLRERIDAGELVSSLPQDGYQRVTTDTGEISPSGPDRDDEALTDWSVDDLPEGFDLTMNQVQPLPGRSGPVRHLMVSDGLATVSIYIEPEDRAEGIDGSRQMGAMNAYGRALDGYQAIAVGEVPAVTVERIANALTPIHSSDQAGN